MVEERMAALDNVPDKKEFVKLEDFMVLMENFRVLRDQVDRATNVLLMGFKAEANLTLKAKVGLQHFEKGMESKLDKI